MSMRCGGRSGGHPNHLELQLFFTLLSAEPGQDKFRIGAKTQGGFGVQSEQCQVGPADALDEPECSRVAQGKHVESSQRPAPAVPHDRLNLVNASELAPFGRSTRLFPESVLCAPSEYW